MWTTIASCMWLILVVAQCVHVYMYNNDGEFLGYVGNSDGSSFKAP